MLNERAVLCGSVNLPTSEDVFRAVASQAGDVVSRIPDGETGPRVEWIVWQRQIFDRNPLLEEGERVVNEYRSHPRRRIRNGVQPEDIDLGSLGYADAALESYATFARLKREGVIAPHVRFQVSLPTALAVVGIFIDLRDGARLEPVYERHLLAELQRIADGVPHGELTIQWDSAVEFAMIEGARATFLEGDLLAQCAGRTARLIDATPGDVEVGLHLCYGDCRGQALQAARRHLDPRGDGQRVLASLTRPLDVDPPAGADRARRRRLLRAAAELVLPEGTTLYLGLLHHEDGVEGARRRIAAAKVYVDDFGVATECGMGRDAAPEDIPALLRLHAAAGRELEEVVV